MRLHAKPLLVLLVSALSGCAVSVPSKVRVDRVEGALPSCGSFAWNASGGDATSLTEQRVQAAALRTLEAKGYTQSNDKPDCRIAYVLTTYENSQAKPRVGVGVGGGSGGVGGGVGITLPIGKRKAQRGTFTLDVIDAAKNAQVWRGSVEAEFRSGEISEEEARVLVEQVLAQYPDRP